MLFSACWRLSRQRDQALALDESPHAIQLRASANKPGELNRQIVRAVAERPQRRTPFRQAVDPQLIQRLRLEKVLQAMLAERNRLRIIEQPLRRL